MLQSILQGAIKHLNKLKAQVNTLNEAAAKAEKVSPKRSLSLCSLAFREATTAMAISRTGLIVAGNAAFAALLGKTEASVADAVASCERIDSVCPGLLEHLMALERSPLASMSAEITLSGQVHTVTSWKSVRGSVATVQHVFIARS